MSFRAQAQKMAAQETLSLVDPTVLGVAADPGLEDGIGEEIEQPRADKRDQDFVPSSARHAAVPNDSGA